MGSGNIGATNVHRTQGGKAGVIVLLLDIFKGWLAVAVAGWLTHGSPLAIALAAALVTLGHCYPALLKFKGGKAVACFVGAFLYIAPWAVLAVLIIFVAVVMLWRYISLASVLCAALFPFLFWVIYRPRPELFAAAIFCCALIVYRHKANIERLRAGKESVFSLKGGRA